MDPFSILGTLLSVPLGILKWCGARVGVASTPNLVLRDWKTVEVGADPRPAWYHWLHVRCTNAQRTGLSRWLTTDTATACHAIVQFWRDGVLVWWDDAPFAGRIDPTDNIDLMADDDRAFIPLFLELEHEVPDPRNPSEWLRPGVYPTGKKFFGGISERLPEGSYTVTVKVLQGSRERLSIPWNGTIQVGAGGRPIRRSLPALPDSYVRPTRAVNADTGPFVLLDYVVDFKREPQNKTRGLRLRNSADAPAVNVSVSCIQAPTGTRATFSTLPHLFKDTPQEIVANVEGMGPLFAHDLAEVLHDHYQEKRAVGGLAELFQPIQVPLMITYEDGSGHRFRSKYCIDYVPGHQTAKARFISRESADAP